MIFTSVDILDEPFFRSMLQVCGENTYMEFAIMGQTISDKALTFIIQSAEELLSNPVTQLVISIGIALNHSVPNGVHIGSWGRGENTIYVESFNQRTFNYVDLKRLLPHAKYLADSIKDARLDQLETVIWIDHWFQENIQYIQDRETNALGKTYVCPDVERQAIVSDVFLSHYGVCEDIAASIAVVLNLCAIPCEVIQGNEHAWVIVLFEGKYYIWDCTHNITRNENQNPQALRAISYTDAYTLIGTNTYPDNYPSIELFEPMSDGCYSRERLARTEELLFRSHKLSSTFNPTYCFGSYIKTE